MNFQQHRLLMESENLQERTEWGVLVSLVYHADPQSGESFPGRDLIAKEARVTVRCAEQTLESLLQRGFISLISGGGGKAKKTVYLVHIERGEAKGAGAHTANALRPLEPAYSEPGSPYNANSEAYTANARTETESYTANATQTANAIQRTPRQAYNAIQRTPRQAYKEEVINKRNEELCGEGGDAREDSPPPRATPDNDFETLVFEAIFEINGRTPDRRNARDQIELSRLWELLKPFPDGSDAAAEILRRFSHWDRPRPPQLSQIVSEWEPMERIARLARRQEEKQEMINATPNQRFGNDRAAEGRRLRALAYPDSGNSPSKHQSDG